VTNLQRLPRGTKKRHHYIPEFYTKGFLDSAGAIYVYEKGKPGPRPSSPKNVGVETHFYTADTIDGARDSDLIEDFMAAADDPASTVLQRIVTRLPLSTQDKTDFAYFMALMHLRVPAFRVLNQELREQTHKQEQKLIASDPEWFDLITDDIEETTGEQFSEEDRELIRQVLLEESYTVTFHPEDHMRMITVANDVYPTLVRMRWTFCEVPDGHHAITSDNPMVYLDPTREHGAESLGGLSRPTSEVTFPLTRGLYLRASWDGPDLTYVHAPRSSVKDWNRRVIRFASRYVFAHIDSGALQNKVQKWATSRVGGEVRTKAMPNSAYALFGRIVLRS
jgi:hypothetical protein